MFESISVINKRSEGRHLVIFGSPKHDPKSIAICPGALTNHFGIIKNYGNFQQYITKTGKASKIANLFAVCRALLDPVWGRGKTNRV